MINLLAPFLRIPRARTVQPFFLNSVPKCGTHLLIYTMNAMPGLQHASTTMQETCVAGLESVFSAKPAPESGEYTFEFGHVPYNAAVRDTFVRLGLKQVLIIRDPRDQVLSLAHYMENVESIPTYVAEMPLEQRIKLAITGGEVQGAPKVQTMAHTFQAFSGWLDCPDVCVVRYEQLVGPKGGGDQVQQFSDIDRLAKHVGLQLTRNEIAEVAEKAYGHPGTFRKGQIGQWRHAFTPEHIRLVKEVAGEVLINLGYESSLDW